MKVNGLFEITFQCATNNNILPPIVKVPSNLFILMCMLEQHELGSVPPAALQHIRSA